MLARNAALALLAAMAACSDDTVAQAPPPTPSVEIVSVTVDGADRADVHAGQTVLVTWSVDVPGNFTVTARKNDQERQLESGAAEPGLPHGTEFPSYELFGGQNEVVVTVTAREGGRPGSASTVLTLLDNPCDGNEGCLPCFDCVDHFCRARCIPGAVCDAGACRCPDGSTECSGICVNTQTDANHCGSCPIRCNPPDLCFGGECRLCPQSQLFCTPDCVDASTDPAHCGTCDRQCAPDQVCRQGRCGCAEGATDVNDDELCNGQDDNCDGAVPASEMDGDSDGYWPCQGDCDDADPTVHPLGTEVCDHKDNDCADGIPAAEADSDGDRFTVCAPVPTKDPAILGGADCDDGRSDVFPAAADPPDDLFLDQDCDGIDGETDRAVFVRVTGANTAGCGTPAAPCRTIQAGISRAQAAGKNQVYVGAGNYSLSGLAGDAFTDAFSVVPGISVYGRYSPTSWERGDGYTDHVWTSLPNLRPTGNFVAVLAEGINVPTVIDGLVIQSDDATGGGSSVALLARNAPGLRLNRVRLRGGLAAGGANGTDGADGQKGADGRVGTDGVEDDVSTLQAGGPAGCGGGQCPNAPLSQTYQGVTCSAGAGGNGGLGGYGGSGDGAHTTGDGVGGVGESGAAATCGGTTVAAGGAGGASGTYFCGDCTFCTCSDDAYNAGGSGSVGTSGADGAHATAASALTLGTDGLFTPARAGTGGFGRPGGGGGGGGGGAGGHQCAGICHMDDTGGEGGGGGQGGTGGDGGVGGGQGGASVGLLLVNSQVTLTGCRIETRGGGKGGNGGMGGDAGGRGLGQTGGDGMEASAPGGPGHHGGYGGSGGGGKGGNGGASYGVWKADVGSAIAGEAPVYGIGSGGAAGAGGRRGSPGASTDKAADGSAGPSGNSN